MGEHFTSSRRKWWAAAGATTAAAVVAGGVVFAVRSGSSSASPPAVGARQASVRQAAPVTTPSPVTVALSTPAPGATGVDGSKPVVLTTSSPLSPGGGTPTISPSVQGSWKLAGDQVTFTPAEALAPSTTYTVTVPAGLKAAGGGAAVASTTSFRFTTSSGSVLALQEMLAQLGYLPVSWTQTAGTPAVPPAQAVFDPPAGQFAWTWSSVPTTLAAEWVPDQYTTMVKGAVMAFESDQGLAVDGVAGPHVWAALVATLSSGHPATNTHGYTYSLANQGVSPETLTVWHDGTVLSQSGANTGIAQAPTPDGTFAVDERLATQIMRGTNPDGTKYADPVAWVAYFNGGDAIHYISRSYYGSRQSLGCVEVPYAVGQKVWPYETIGSLVTVVG